MIFGHDDYNGNHCAFSSPPLPKYILSASIVVECDVLAAFLGREEE